MHHTAKWNIEFPSQLIESIKAYRQTKECNSLCDNTACVATQSHSFISKLISTANKFSSLYQPTNFYTSILLMYILPTVYIPMTFFNSKGKFSADVLISIFLPWWTLLYFYHVSTNLFFLPALFLLPSTTLLPNQPLFHFLHFPCFRMFVFWELVKPRK